MQFPLTQRCPLEHTRAEPLHAPFTQVSFCVQESLSLHEPPFLGGLVHLPVAGWHWPTSWQTSRAEQITGF